MFSSRVLTAEDATQERLEGLVQRVEAALFAGGLPVAEPWDPRSGFTFLLELWSAERQRDVTSEQLSSELRRHWGITDSRVLAYLTGLGPDPLDGHLTLTRRAEADDRELVQAVLAKVFTDQRVHAGRERIMDAMAVSRIEHLRAVAVDVTSIALIGDKVHAFGTMAHSEGKHEIAIAAAGARLLLEEARTATEGLMNLLTNHEVGRLRLDADHHFQTACLEAFTARNRTTRLDDRLEASRGTFGPMPWWRVALKRDDCDHALASLDAQTLSIALRHDEGSTSMSLHLYDPSGAYFYTFSYTLTSVPDVFQLMLLGRAERVGIDFETEVDGERLRLGTLVPLLAEEIAEHLRVVATAALRQHLGFGDGFEDAVAVRAAVDEALLRPAAQRIWSRPSREYSRAVDVSDDPRRALRA
ncbi:hypothetical protein [Ornithinimicrobium murale]|uniref:hypothetical protein n=1 Tax=Ornithinimicrobium murale TaxID=1050153 RepID=UPI0013B40F38|nr:hypothetical protein [Ornithinimicrobium murale]